MQRYSWVVRRINLLINNDSQSKVPTASLDVLDSWIKPQSELCIAKCKQWEKWESVTLSSEKTDSWLYSEQCQVAKNIFLQKNK